ncbi:thioether cross-link-forming SCIFF peptide maturase [Natranaerofaba carboxydovora]|uniref:thioether cross-link-forming SCIFF peptide maturase n=1 Tax=Natranaerofaba carboxydovora TaxID=2742683 RepID=UPI001F13F6F3|nr:thioether cross-link-forming SCIFF peptide maturase [Natranaerofaba carboxydovora]UMZ74013.1 Anaerobic sulfatase-maturating enzyme [Natranaerofaba carboxydovora]
MKLPKESIVHTFEFNNYYYAIDTNSGSLHELNGTAFDVINKINKYKELNLHNIDKNNITNELDKKWPGNTINKVLEEVETLIQKEQLFSDIIIETDKIKKNNDQLKALCLNISHTCNMKCKYCFAGGGTFGQDTKKKDLMDFDTAKKAVDFLLENSNERKNCEIDFFGGEPLLNWEVVKKTVHYAREKASKNNKNIKFTLTTNGLSLDNEVMRFLNEHDFAVVLSLDGRKEINDTNRKSLYDDKSTYDSIVGLYQEFVESRDHKEYFVRGTFSADNLDFTRDVEHIYDLGFKDISLEPVVCSKEKNYSLENVDLDLIKKEYERLTLFYEEKADKGEGFSFYHFEINLDGGPCVKKRFSGCGAGSEYLAITPSGEIYPCHQFVGNDEFVMGDLKKSFLVDQSVKNKFNEHNFLSKKKCKECWAKFHCGGGCHANAYLFNGNMEEPHKTGCELLKKRIECALYLASKGLLQRYR